MIYILFNSDCGMIQYLLNKRTASDAHGLYMLDCIDHLVICNNLQGDSNTISIKPQKVKEIIHKVAKNVKAYWLHDADYNAHGLNFDQELGEE